MNKTIRGFLVLGGVGATALGGYVAYSRLRQIRSHRDPIKRTEIVREEPIEPQQPKVEIIREDSTGEQ